MVVVSTCQYTRDRALGALCCQSLCQTAIAYIVADMSDGPWLTLAEAHEKTGIAAVTLRRLCSDRQLVGRKQGRNWVVSEPVLLRYVAARRRAGASTSRVKLDTVDYLGFAPNPTLKDADGWRFRIQAKADHWVAFTIWMSAELVAILRDEGYEVGDLLLRSAERLAEDEMIRLDSLPANHQIVLGTQDRLRLLVAAGRAPDFLHPGEAEAEDGVPVEYDFGASGFDLWLGDHLPAHGAEGFVDAIVDWTYRAGRRVVRAVRLEAPAPQRRSETLRAAVRAYRHRCERLGEVPGEWLSAVEIRLSGSASYWPENDR
jgi:hypothetical protein